MRILLSIIDILLPPSTTAASIQDLGSGIPGIKGMWDQIVPYSAHVGDNIFVAGVAIVVNAVTWAIGSAAIVVILYGSIRMVVSAGNEENVRKAWKEIILYACLGLIFAVLSNIIVHFVINVMTQIATS